MKKFVVTTFGLLLAISAASPNGWAAPVLFNGGTTDFLTGTNWTPNGVPSNGGDQYFINQGLTSTYTTNVPTSVNSLIVGGNPLPALGTDGTFNMSTGSLTITGGNGSFQIARDLGGKGTMTLFGNAQFAAGAGSADCCVVGARDQGVLNITDTATVTTPNTYWRVGNYGPDNDDGLGPLQGNGLIHVSGNGSFNGMFMFLGDSDSKGELRVSGHGSVNLTGGDLIPNVSTNRPDRLALVHMIGSTATLNAQNLQSENGAAQVHNQYIFDADAGGVSPIVLVDAVNIGNNDLVVNLNGFSWPIGAPDILLFNAFPGRIFGTFASSVVNGSVVPHVVIYDNLTGDISVHRVPEPSTMLLLGLGMVMVIGAKRRASR